MPVARVPIHQFTPIFHGAIVISVKEDEASRTLLVHQITGLGVASGHSSGAMKYLTYFPQLTHLRACMQL